MSDRYPQEIEAALGGLFVDMMQKSANDQTLCYLAAAVLPYVSGLKEFRPEDLLAGPEGKAGIRNFDRMWASLVGTAQAVATRNGELNPMLFRVFLLSFCEHATSRMRTKLLQGLYAR
jgi:hypothetical protein